MEMEWPLQMRKYGLHYRSLDHMHEAITRKGSKIVFFGKVVYDYKRDAWFWGARRISWRLAKALLYLYDVSYNYVEWVPYFVRLVGEDISVVRLPFGDEESFLRVGNVFVHDPFHWPLSFFVEPTKLIHFDALKRQYVLEDFRYSDRFVVFKNSQYGNTFAVWFPRVGRGFHAVAYCRADEMDLDSSVYDVPSIFLYYGKWNLCNLVNVEFTIDRTFVSQDMSQWFQIRESRVGNTKRYDVFEMLMNKKESEHLRKITSVIVKKNLVVEGKSIDSDGVSLIQRIMNKLGDGWTGLYTYEMHFYARRQYGGFELLWRTWLPTSEKSKGELFIRDAFGKVIQYWHSYSIGRMADELDEVCQKAIYE